MTLEEILDGIEAALELERDLGTRTIETGRAFAARQDAAPPPRPAPAPKPPPAPTPAPAPSPAAPAVLTAGDSPAAPAPKPASGVLTAGESPAAPAPSPAAPGVLTAGESPAEAAAIVFLLAEPLALPAAKTMMDNIVAYVEKISSRKAAVVCGAGALPPAQIYIAMGEKARERWFPGERFPAERISTSKDGKTVALTRNPDDVMRFGSPAATKEIRRRMMQTFTAANRRLESK